jgi:hypothetical protein
MMTPFTCACGVARGIKDLAPRLNTALGLALPAPDLGWLPSVMSRLTGHSS